MYFLSPTASSMPPYRDGRPTADASGAGHLPVRDHEPDLRSRRRRAYPLREGCRVLHGVDRPAGGGGSCASGVECARRAGRGVGESGEGQGGVRGDANRERRSLTLELAGAARPGVSNLGKPGPCQ